jgi:hypothetical protein
VQFGLFALAFTRLGIPPEYLFSLLFLSIRGVWSISPSGKSGLKRNRKSGR